MRATRIAAAFLALASWAASAADLEVQSTTLIGGRPDVVDGQVKTVAPLYERVGLRARNLQLGALEDVAVAVDAWGGLILPGSQGSIGASDVNLAFIEGKLFKKRLKLRLGRQFVTGGTARASYFDGLLAEYKSQAGIGLSAFAGIPVEARFGNYTRGDFVFGSRLSFGPSIHTEVGLSYLHLLRRGSLARQDVGLDAHWQPVSSITLRGALIWAIADTRIAELDLGPLWQPTENIEVLVNYRRTAPELFLPLTSIFTVFADTSRDDLGASVSWAPCRCFTMYADARLLWINGEQGFDAGARLTYRPKFSPTTYLTVQGRRLLVPSNGYHQARLGVRHVLPVGLSLSVDLETYALDKPVRGQLWSYSASGTASWQFNKSWLAGLTLFGATTPTFESRYEVVGKLVYLFAAGGAN